MDNNIYQQLKTFVNTFTLPGTILSVEKTPDGTCGEIRFFAINEVFKKNSFKLFLADNSELEYSYKICIGNVKK